MSKFTDTIMQMRAMMKPCIPDMEKCKGCPLSEKSNSNVDRKLCHPDELANFVKSLIVEASHDPSVRALVFIQLLHESEYGFVKQDVDIELKAKHIDILKEMNESKFDFQKFSKKMKTADEVSEELDGVAEALFNIILGDSFFGMGKDDE